MKIIVCGCDGYIGNALIQRLVKLGHSVIGIDNLSRRYLVEKEMNSFSATKMYSINAKAKKIGFKYINIDIALDNEQLDKIIEQFKPDAIYNLAHQPSGPFSMNNQDNANYSLMNNIINTNNILWSIKRHIPQCHYITIGSTGCYDHYNNIDIEEGYFEMEWKGRKSEEMIFPRRPTSIYHTSKVASTYLIDYLTKTWNLICTDVQQSVVFGLYTDETDESKYYSRFDSDESFGTVLNRFIVQALLKEPLTIYGEGRHQRGFLSLNDSVQALIIALNNPPERGKVQDWNQLSEWHSMNDIAQMVKEVGNKKFNLDVKGINIDTPRNEYTGEHYYHYVTEKLKNFGYKPTRTIKEEIEYCFNVLKDRNLEKLKNVIMPKIIFKDSK